MADRRENVGALKVCLNPMRLSCLSTSKLQGTNNESNAIALARALINASASLFDRSDIKTQKPEREPFLKSGPYSGISAHTMSSFETLYYSCSR